MTGNYRGYTIAPQPANFHYYGHPETKSGPAIEVPSTVTVSPPSTKAVERNVFQARTNVNVLSPHQSTLSNSSQFLNDVNATTPTYVSQQTLPGSFGDGNATYGQNQPSGSGLQTQAQSFLSEEHEFRPVTPQAELSADDKRLRFTRFDNDKEEVHHFHPYALFFLY
jgi:hypothetical protein